MIEWISNTIFTTSVFFSLWLYWLPLAVTALGHTFSIVGGVAEDIKEPTKYSRVTYGDILLGYALSTIPWVNMGTAIYQIGPIFRPVIWLLDKPVVKRVQPPTRWNEHK